MVRLKLLPKTFVLKPSTAVMQDLNLWVLTKEPVRRMECGQDNNPLVPVSALREFFFFNCYVVLLGIAPNCLG